MHLGKSGDVEGLSGDYFESRCGSLGFRAQGFGSGGLDFTRVFWVGREMEPQVVPSMSAESEFCIEMALKSLNPEPWCSVTSLKGRLPYPQIVCGGTRFLERRSLPKLQQKQQT